MSSEATVGTYQYQAPQAEMPRYKSHKEVHALKITGVGPTMGDDSAELFVENPFGPIMVGGPWVRKHQPVVGGYYVIYGDGYASFSPAKAFEEGYTRI